MLGIPCVADHLAAFQEGLSGIMRTYDSHAHFQRQTQNRLLIQCIPCLLTFARSLFVTVSVNMASKDSVPCNIHLPCLFAVPYVCLKKLSYSERDPYILSQEHNFTASCELNVQIASTFLGYVLYLIPYCHVLMIRQGVSNGNRIYCTLKIGK
jgi:hypothetical protein